MPCSECSAPAHARYTWGYHGIDTRSELLCEQCGWIVRGFMGPMIVYAYGFLNIDSVEVEDGLAASAGRTA